MAYGYGTMALSAPKVKGQAPNAPPAPLAPNWMDLAKTVTDRSQWFHLKQLYQQQPGRSDSDQYHQALYSNPLASTFDTETAGPRRGLLGRIKQATRETPLFSQKGRLATGKIAAFVGGASALGAASGGFSGGAGGAAASGGSMGGPLGALAPVSGGGGVGFGSLAGAAGGISGAAAAGTGGSMVGAMGGGGFPWAPVIQGGSQLLSGYMNKRASDKAAGKQQQNIQAALAQLSPEAIRALVQMFYTQNYAMLNPQMQAAQRGVAAGAGRTGLTGAGVTRQLQAGIPGQFANMALNSATQQGLGVAGQRAGIYSGAPVNTPYSFGNDLQGIMQMLGRYGILRNNQQQTQQTQQAQQNQTPWWISGPGYDDNERP